MDNLEFREWLYDLVCGNLNLENLTLPEGRLVESEFEEGSFCSDAYDRMLSAYSRLCRRLGVEEWADADAEAMITELRRIGKYLALKMFDYGVYFGGQK